MGSTSLSVLEWKHHILIWGLAVGILFHVFPAYSDAGKEARAQFEQGVKLFEEGEFDKASIAFNRAYQLRPSYKILFNIAQVENGLKRYARALEAYSRYLKEGKNHLSEERIKSVNVEIERLQTLVGTLVVECPISGAIVMLDGERRGETPLKRDVFVEMGTHEIVLRKGMKVLYQETFRIAGGQQFKISLGDEEETGAVTGPEPGPAAVEESQASEEEQALEPVPEANIVAEAPGKELEESLPGPAVQSEAEAEAPKRVWTWVTIGIGAAAGVAGGVVGGLSMKKKSDLKGSCNDNNCDPAKKSEADAIERMNLTADVLYGVAAAGIITGLVLFFVEPKTHSEKTVAVVPSVWDQGGGLTVSGRF